MSEQSPTHNQIDEQLAADQAASVLVERSNGDVSVGQVMAHGEHGARVYFANLNTESNGEAMRLDNRVVSSEDLSDERQQQLAAELAGLALRDAAEPRPVRTWAQWVEDNPRSQQEIDADRQARDKNIQLSQIAAKQRAKDGKPYVVNL